MIKCSVYNKELVDWVCGNQKGVSRAELTAKLNKRFDTEFSVNVVTSFCRRCGFKSGVNGGQLKKGGTPWNKGKPHRTNSGYSFKKGHGGFNTRPIGSERVCSKDGYILVKTKAPRTWDRKHLIEWRKHHGKIPQGHCIRFLDNDRTNCNIENLVCIHRGVNAVINHQNPTNTDNPDINHAIILTEKINHTIKNIDRYRSNAQ